MQLQTVARYFSHWIVSYRPNGGIIRSESNLFTRFTLSNACRMLLVLRLSFHGLFTRFTLSICCLCCARRFKAILRVSDVLMVAIRSLFCACLFMVSSPVSHALLAALRTLSLCLLSTGLLRFVCCAFAGNTYPHGQANLRACSVASHCGHTFLRRIDIPDCSNGSEREIHHAVCFQVHVSSP